MRSSTILSRVRAASHFTAHPALAAVASLVIALGIAAPTTMFSIARGITADVPIRELNDVIDLRLTDRSEPGSWGQLRRHEYMAVTDRLTLVEGVGAYVRSNYDLAPDGQAALRRPGLAITPNGFGLLGIEPVIGRGFDEADTHIGATPTVIISYALWRDYFDQLPTVLGHQLLIDGSPHVVIGVMPAGFQFPEREHVWVPLGIDVANASTQGPTYWTFARRSPGASVEQIEDLLDAIAVTLEVELPETNSNIRFVTQPLEEALVSPEVDGVLRILVTIMMLVLLIACANVGGLLLTKGIDESYGTAIRMAFGTPRHRIVSAMLIEGALFVTLGGTLGLALSRGLISWVSREMGSQLSFWMTFELDWTVLAFVTCCMGIATLGIVLLPMLHVWDLDVWKHLSAQSRATSSLWKTRSLSALVTLEVALSTCLLLLGALVMQGFLQSVRQSDFDPASVLAAGWVAPTGVDSEDELLAFHRRLLTALARDGRFSVSLTTELPGLWADWRRLELEGVQYARVLDRPRVRTIAVSPGFFDNLGPGMLRGRDFSWSDDNRGNPVVIVNSAFAHKYFGEGSDPLGKRVRLFGSGEGRDWATVIGVAPPLGVSTGGATDSPEGIYLPLAQGSHREVYGVVVTGLDDPTQAANDVRTAIAETSPRTPVFLLDRLDRIIADARASEQTFATLLTVIGLAALLMALAGLYGTVQFVVSLRTDEFALRMVVGASPRQIAGRILMVSMVPVGIGVSLGIALGAVMVPSLGEAFWVVSFWSPAIHGVIAGLLLLAALGAVLPAVRKGIGIDVSELLSDA